MIISPLQEEGEYYNIPIPPEDEDEVEKLRKKMADIHTAKEKPKPRVKSAVVLNQSQRDVIKASDFNFLTVLGKGSFGKVRLSFN